MSDKTIELVDHAGLVVTEDEWPELEDGFILFGADDKIQYKMIDGEPTPDAEFEVKDVTATSAEEMEDELNKISMFENVKGMGKIMGFVSKFFTGDDGEEKPSGFNLGTALKAAARMGGKATLRVVCARAVHVSVYTAYVGIKKVSNHDNWWGDFTRSKFFETGFYAGASVGIAKVCGMFEDRHPVFKALADGAMDNSFTHVAEISELGKRFGGNNWFFKEIMKGVAK